MGQVGQVITIQVTRWTASSYCGKACVPRVPVKYFRWFISLFHSPTNFTLNTDSCVIVRWCRKIAVHNKQLPQRDRQLVIVVIHRLNIAIANSLTWRTPDIYGVPFISKHGASPLVSQSTVSHQSPLHTICSDHGSMSYRFRDKRRFRSKIANLTPSLWDFHRIFVSK